MQYEVTVVDSEMPLDKQHEDEEHYTILAESEAHVKLAVTLAIGDRYEAVEFYESPGTPSADEYETDLSGYEMYINGFEVLDEATFQARFTGVDGERYSETTSSLSSAVEWYHDHEKSDPNAEFPDNTTVSYSGWTGATHGSILQRVSGRHIDDFVGNNVNGQP